MMWVLNRATLSHTHSFTLNRNFTKWRHLVLAAAVIVKSPLLLLLLRLTYHQDIHTQVKRFFFSFSLCEDIFQLVDKKSKRLKRFCRAILFSFYFVCGDGTTSCVQTMAIVMCLFDSYRSQKGPRVRGLSVVDVLLLSKRGEIRKKREPIELCVIYGCIILNDSSPLVP